MKLKYRPVESDWYPIQHLTSFGQFDRLKAQLGEPTPHMKIVQFLSEDVGDQERLWRAGAYAAGYSVLTAEAIWREWPYERVVGEPEGVGNWVFENWPGIHTRTPRRCVRTPEAFAECLEGYWEWMHGELPTLRKVHWDSPKEEYDAYWASVNRIPFFGRYISIRLLELLRRWEFMSAELYDIRAMDAESPIRCLSLFETPSVAQALLAGDVAAADYVAQDVLTNWSSDKSYFRFAALLCEYRKSYEDQGDYPGNQTDEELGYTHSRYADHWRARGFETELFTARQALVPQRARGEEQGWTGQRKFAARALRDFGMNWSDLKYDFAASEAAGRPIPWTN